MAEKFLERHLIGDGNFKIETLKEYNMSARDIIILGGLLGLGRDGKWAVDITATLKEIFKRIKNENYPEEKFIRGIIYILESVIIEEIVHSFGENHKSDNEDWIKFILEYVF